MSDPFQDPAILHKEPIPVVATSANLPAVVEEREPEKPPQTPAEARVQAVNSLVCKSMDRASDLRLTGEETQALKATFHDNCFRKGARGKENLLYIEHIHLRSRLDDVLGMGQWCLVPRSRWTEDHGKSTTVYVEAMLLVRGCYITEAIGDMDYYPSNASTNFGDAVEGAESAALRRCCKKMGIGLQAWSKTWCEGWWERNLRGPQTPSSEDCEIITDAQVETLNNLLDDAGLTPERFKKFLSVHRVHRLDLLPAKSFKEACRQLNSVIEKNKAEVAGL